MSLLNGFQGQQSARQPSRAAATDQSQNAPLPGWPSPQQTHAQQQAPQWPQQPAAQPGYGASPYGQAAPQANPYAQQQHDYQYPHAAHAAPAQGGADPYAPQFEPYAAPQSTHAQPRPQAAQPQAAAYQPYPQTQPPAAPYAAQQGYEPQRQAPAQQPSVPFGQPSQAQGGYAQPQQNWGGHMQADPRGFDMGGFGHQAGHAPAPQQAYRPHEQQYHEAEPSLGDWNEPAQHGYQAQNYQAQGYQAQNYQAESDDMGFAQPAGGELEAGYEEELEEEYEVEPPSRFRRPLMIAAALVGAVVVGGGVAQGYKYFLGGSSGNPPVIKSAEGPAKVKPADAGGKQFAHSDSKIMGRLGDGSGSPDDAASTDSDPNGTRKVATLVVGRDGSIQAPPASAAPVQPAPLASVPSAPPGTAVSVPGMTVVDAFGGQKADAPAAAAPAPQKVVVTPPAAAPQKPVTIAKANPVAPAQTGSIDADAPAAAAAAPVKKVKKAVAAAAPSGSVATTGSGFVAVLASVPRSDQSRITALKQFADMQQKYSSVLAGKTPDVAEANLGAKGNYHRLVVGPPGSRDQASAVCSQLKAQGFNDCWVTSY